MFAGELRMSIAEIETVGLRVYFESDTVLGSALDELLNAHSVGLSSKQQSSRGLSDDVDDG